MPLTTLLTLVVFGIAGAVILVHLLGWSEVTGLSDEDAARAVFLRDFPDADIRAVHLSDDHRTAIVETDAGPGLVAVIGTGRLTRRLVAPQVTETPKGLTIRLADFTAPRIKMNIADTKARQRAANLLKG